MSAKRNSLTRREFLKVAGTAAFAAALLAAAVVLVVEFWRAGEQRAAG